MGSGGASQPGDRGDVDDAARPLLAHHGADRLDPEEHPRLVDGDDAVPVVELGSQRPALEEDAGVVDQHVDPLAGQRVGEGRDRASIRRQFEVNSLGPLRVTVALLDNLGAGSKVGIVTSRMGSIEDNTSGGSYGYRMSKAAVNMAGASLANDLRERSIAVALLHPGYVRTDMTGGKGLISAEQSATGLIQRMDALDMDTSGGFWHAQGERLPW